MKSLKEKFGKFEMTKEQVKKVSGGSDRLILVCEDSNGRILGRGTPDRALAICDAVPSCVGCF